MFTSERFAFDGRHVGQQRDLAEHLVAARGGEAVVLGRSAGKAGLGLNACRAAAAARSALALEAAAVRAEGGAKQNGLGACRARRRRGNLINPQNREREQPLASAEEIQARNKK